MSVDGFIKGYKDVPSLAQISKHVKGKSSSGEADKDKDKEIKSDSMTEAIKEEEVRKEAAPVELAPEKASEPPAIVEPEKEERIKSENGEHPLGHTWSVPTSGP